MEPHGASPPAQAQQSWLGRMPPSAPSGHCLRCRPWSCAQSTGRPVRGRTRPRPRARAPQPSRAGTC
eukprot:14235025-Alexandrium_andersonii.AAC.1